MNWKSVLSLASVLFKSYFRASRFGRRSILSNPTVIAVLDALVFAVPFALIAYALPQIPSDLISTVSPLARQLVIVLPVILTSVVILGGILFELGQASGLASSEAVNWLPISPAEYVSASSLSIVFSYSPFLFIGLGVAIPLALNFGMASIVPFFILICVVAFVWGAVIVEAVRSVINRISTTVYKKSGRLGVILRILLVIILLVAVQIAFNPYILYIALAGIAQGVSLAWFIPVIWPSVAVVSFLASDAVKTIIFAGLSVFFTIVIFEAATQLRARYWSPLPVTIKVSTSTNYVPQGKSLLWLKPIAWAIALKELRSLSRRREMARFLAIPVLFVISTLLPLLTAGGSNSGQSLSSVRLVLCGEVSLFLPLMLSSISIGQEGTSIANLYMLPISVSDLINGKLFLPWIMSGISVVAIVILLQFFAPATIAVISVTLVALAFNIVIQGYAGLGTGARFPSFNVGPRARYLSLTGFIVSFIIGGVITIATLTPEMLYEATGLTFLGGGAAGAIAWAIVFTVVVGTILLVLAREYCFSGMKKLLSTLEA